MAESPTYTNGAMISVVAPSTGTTIFFSAGDRRPAATSRYALLAG
jgi:hypothetical protein